MSLEDWTNLGGDGLTTVTGGAALRMTGRIGPLSRAPDPGGRRTNGGEASSREIPPHGPFDFASLPETIFRPRQEPHLRNTWPGVGGYLNNLEDAQAVLTGARSGNATLLGFKDGQPVVRYDGVTGFNHNPGSGYPHQPTNVFWIQGLRYTSIVPMSPVWRP